MFWRNRKINWEIEKWRWWLKGDGKKNKEKEIKEEGFGRWYDEYERKEK